MSTSAAAAPVVLILGAGSNVGSSVARAFSNQGFRVAVSSRTVTAKTLKDSEKEEDASGSGNNFLHVRSDLSDSTSVPNVFAKVREALGAAPSVVVYNAAALTFAPDPQNPLSLAPSDLARDLAINTTSVLAAAQQAVQGFDQLPPPTATTAKAFIYTGNCLNVMPIVPLLSLGVGKAATAHLISNAAQAFKGKGYRFYYADQRNADGGNVGRQVDGEAHGQFYVELATEDQSQAEKRTWQQTFVKGTGYVDFATAKPAM